MTCPRCRTADVHVVEVDRDGRLTLCCDDPNCGHRWTVRAHPSQVVKVRELGATLAAHQRARLACPADQPQARLMAKGAERSTSRELLEFVTDPPGGGPLAGLPSPSGQGAPLIDLRTVS